MNIAQLQQEIIRLKKEKDVCILAHSYQAREICEVADFTGDSYKLSVDASKADNQNILMCGVRFMAETCKILSPEKTVVLASPIAGCAMADQMDKALIEQVKEHYPNHTVVAYINTTASLKTICDVCVTSSSAVKIVSKIPNKDILFIPDCNLGAHVAAQCPDKNIQLLNGGCPIHACVNTDDVAKAKALYPDAELLVHPECVPAVCAQVTCLPVSELCVRSSEQPPPPPSAANTSTSFPCALEMILFSFCSGMLQYSLPFSLGLQNAIFICVSCPRSNSLNG